MSLLLDTPLPTPQNLTGRTVVVVHAHPDDEAIFTGATIRRLADHGARVVLVTATTLVAMVAWIATMVPAVRASRQDPTRALRD